MDDNRDALQAALEQRYTIERPIGRGGMATVFLAREHHPTREVAIKVLDPALGDRIGRERFLREVEIVSKLTHPHVVPIFAAGEADGLLYYVMPYIAGLSLRSRLEQERTLPLGDAIHVAHDVADALGYAHSQGIIHRDVKPENILLSGGHSLVTDFGIARGLTVAAVSGPNLTVAGIAIGTPGYMSPEQASGAAEIDARSDVYSLAGVVYEMLTGKRPFTGLNLDGMTRNASGDRSTIPPQLEDVLRRALAWDPDDRFRSTAEFAAALSDSQAVHAHGVHHYVEPAARPPTKSVAVLPFANLSADPDNEYFSDGITDDIIAQLSKIGDLKVTSRTSAMLYKGTDKNLQTIGRELGVATVLEGSVRRAANRVRIISQLIDVQTDAHLWAETYDRDLTDIFAIQSDVAGRIAEALQTTLSPTARESINRKPTENIDAYNQYLLGTHFFNRFTPASVEKALKCFEEAIALDPEFALAYVGLANAYFSIGAGQSQGYLAPSEAFEFAKEAVERALEIDDTIADAHATLGSVHTWYEWDWPAAEAAFERATSLGCGCQEPNVKYGFYLAARGRHAEALAAASTALELDPISLIVHSHLALQYWWARRFDEALKQATRALNLDATFQPALAVLGWVYIQFGRTDEAIQVFEGIIDEVGRLSSMLAALACAYTRADRGDAAAAIQDELEQRKAGEELYVSSREIALVRAWRGDREGAMDWLERAYEERAPFLSFVNVDAIWDDLREEPRFRALVQRIGLS